MATGRNPPPGDQAHPEEGPSIGDTSPRSGSKGSPSKLSILENGQAVAKQWGRGYELQEYGWGKRVRCSTDGDRIHFLLALLERYPGPFSVTYILEDATATPRVEEGRYSRSGLTRNQVEFFLQTYSDFLQHDSRHHIFINCLSKAGAIFYDQHDYFYVYGSPDQLLLKLRSEGFLPMSYELGEHLHTFQNDPAPLYDLMEFWPWTYTPLELTDVTRPRIGLLRFAWLKLRACWFDRTSRAPD